MSNPKPIAVVDTDVASYLLKGAPIGFEYCRLLRIGNSNRLRHPSVFAEWSLSDRRRLPVGGSDQLEVSGHRLQVIEFLPLLRSIRPPSLFAGSRAQPCPSR